MNVILCQITSIFCSESKMIGLNDDILILLFHYIHTSITIDKDLSKQFHLLSQVSYQFRRLSFLVHSTTNWLSLTRPNQLHFNLNEIITIFTKDTLRTQQLTSIHLILDKSLQRHASTLTMDCLVRLFSETNMNLKSCKLYLPRSYTSHPRLIQSISMCTKLQHLALNGYQDGISLGSLSNIQLTRLLSPLNLLCHLEVDSIGLGSFRWTHLFKICGKMKDFKKLVLITGPEREMKRDMKVYVHNCRFIIFTKNEYILEK